MYIHFTVKAYGLVWGGGCRTLMVIFFYGSPYNHNV